MRHQNLTPSSKNCSANNYLDTVTENYWAQAEDIFVKLLMAQKYTALVTILCDQLFANQGVACVARQKVNDGQQCLGGLWSGTTVDSPNFYVL